jgi:hypothetical protein
MHIFVNMIEREYIQYGVVRGRSMVFNVEYALQIVDICENLGVKVLGIDGFFLSPGITQPSLEDSIDFSNQEGGVYEMARNFMLSRMNSQIHFELILDLVSEEIFHPRPQA